MAKSEFESSDDYFRNVSVVVQEAYQKRRKYSMNVLEISNRLQNQNAIWECANNV